MNYKMNFTRRGELASKQISKCQITDKKQKYSVHYEHFWFPSRLFVHIAKFSLFLPQIVTILDEFFRVLQLALFTLKNNQILQKLSYYSTQELYLQWIAHSLSNEHPHQKISDLGQQRICQPKLSKNQTFSRARAIAFHCQYVSYVKYSNALL